MNIPTQAKTGLEWATRLLHSRPSWVSEGELFEWVEYSTMSKFRTNILKSYHKERLLEYDGKAGQVRISPLGSKHVEEEILKTRAGYRAINS